MQGAFTQNADHQVDHEKLGEELTRKMFAHDLVTQNIATMLDFDEITTAQIENYYTQSLIDRAKEAALREYAQNPESIEIGLSAQESADKYWVQFLTEALFQECGIHIDDSDGGVNLVIPMGFTQEKADALLERFVGSATQLYQLGCEVLKRSPTELSLAEYLQVSDLAYQNDMPDDKPFTTWFKQAQMLNACEACAPDHAQ